MTATNNIQYRLSNGSWVDCEARTSEFLERAVRRAREIVEFRAKNGIPSAGSVPNYAEITTSDVALAALAAGNCPSIGTDWYAEIRAKPAPIQRPAVKMVKASCGHTIPQSSLMTASLGTCCPDCYDRLSF